MIYCIDIDGILCSKAELYQSAIPNAEIIRLVNRLYDAGHTIKLFTARGSRNRLDFRKLTKNQLKDWGVNYHELIFGKPHADLYVDDQMISVEQWIWNTRQMMEDG